MLSRRLRAVAQDFIPVITTNPVKNRNILEVALDSGIDTYASSPSARVLAILGTIRTFSEVIDVVRVQSSHGDTSIGRHVDMRLLRQCFGLRRVQSGETESKERISTVHASNSLPIHLNIPI